jgi:CBS domain-containing protein
MRISAIMTRDVKACGPQDTLNVPAQMMWEGDCGAVPVIDEAARVVGMITDRDICMSAHLRNELLSNISVGDVMAKEIFTCVPEDTVAHAEQLMKSKQVRRLPIVDDNRRLLGILSLADIAKTMKGQPPSSTHAMTLAAVGDTLARIAERRNGTL